jgi:ferric iron reductase protein FhuF
VQLGEPEGDGWIRATRFTGGDDDLYANILEGKGVTRGSTDTKLIASFFLHTYLWAYVGAGLGCFLVDRRVPELSPEQVAIHFNQQFTADNVALLSPTFACLPDDPAATHPDAVVLPCEEALRDRYREQLLAHMEPIIEWLTGYTTLSRRAMWLIVADRTATAIVWLYEQLSLPSQSAAEVEALLQQPGTPLVGRTRIEHYEWQGNRDWFLARAGCCLAYRLPTNYYCDSCPVLSPAERDARRQARLAG